MKILVTGGAGFIGSFIVDELVLRGHDVTIYDNLSTQVHPDGAKPLYVNKNARFILGDVKDYDSLKKNVCDADVVFHEAAMVGVGQSQYEIKKYVDTNTGGTANLLDILANNKHKVRKLIVAASMSSYGEGLYACRKCGKVRPGLRTSEDMGSGLWEPSCPFCKGDIFPIPITEDDIQHATSIYAITKQDQELMALNIGRTYGLPVVALRYFNVYGPRQSLSNPYTGVMAIFLSRLLNNNPPVIYEDGLQSRDFVSVHDIVQANMLAMEKSEADYNVFNVGSGNVTTILSIAEKLALVTGKEIKPNVTGKFRKGDVRHCFADITKISKALGFVPRTRFEDGLKEVLLWSSGAASKDHFDSAAAELKAKGLI